MEAKSDSPQGPRRLGRGLAQVSHVFLSGVERRSPPPEAAPRRVVHSEDSSVWLPDVRLIAVTSGVGIRGKTTLTANVAYGMHLRSRRIGIIGADATKPDITEITGSSPQGSEPYQGMTCAEYGKLVTGDLTWGQGPHAAGVPDYGQGADDRPVSRIEWLSGRVNTMIADIAPRTESNRIFYRLARLVVIVAEPGTSKMQAAYAAIKHVHGASPGVRIGLVINMTRGYDESEQCFRKISSVCRRFLKINPRNYGYIVHSEAVKEACERAVPLVRACPESKAADCVDSITGLILMDESAIARRRREVRLKECALRGGK